MTLFDLKDVEMPAVLTGEHWQMFDPFSRLPLYAAIVAELEGYLTENVLDSSIVGSQILRRIRERWPEVFDGYPEEVTGGLFGMVLWNMLARQDVAWRFMSKGVDELGDPTGKVYFRGRA